MMKFTEEFANFVFGCPLYTVTDFPDDRHLKAIILGFYGAKVDGHCSECGKSSTFTRSAIARNFDLDDIGDFKRAVAAKNDGIVRLTCARDSNHEIRFCYAATETNVTKFGQIPSLADIANDEAAIYRSVLNKTDSAELHKAIGLAANGVGIGSFVYLRRIFERLVKNRFDEFKTVEGWKDEDFLSLRMDERVKFLDGHLPAFLVENRKLYSILSKGIHELSDEVCLKAFDPIKYSIKIILEEDKKKQEELKLKKIAADAISGFLG
jgi:hypothetical protein